MADSVVEILNTTLTSTELPDSSTEYTLLTTDADTSYVIKDVQFNTYGNSLFPTINGSSIGKWTSSLSGTEVIDVSSNLKVTSSSLYEEDDFFALEGTFFATRQDAGTTNYFSSSKSVVAQIALFNQQNVLVNQKQSDVSQFTNQNLYEGTDAAAWNKVYNNIMYTIVKRSIGTFVIYKYPSHGERVTIDASSTMAWPDPANDKIWYENAGALKCIDLNTDTTTTVRASFPITTQNYQRIGLNGDWAFLLQQTSNTLYGYNTATDVLVEITTIFPTTANSDVDFFVSYDKTDDKFYFYFYDNNEFFLNISNITRTTMNNYTTDQTGLTINIIDKVGAMDHLLDGGRSQGLSQGLVGSLSVGNRFYYKAISNNEFGKIYEAITYIDSTYETASNLVADIGIMPSSDNRYNQNPWLIAYVPNQHQVKDYGSLEHVNKINLRITGIKTTA